MGRPDQTLELTPSAPVNAEPVRVEVVDGPSRGAVADLSNELVVGNARECQLRLDDPTVSGRHAALTLEAGAVRVRDLGSRNGTRYLGSKIDEARVPVGASIRLGKSTLRIVGLGSGPPASERRELAGLTGSSLAMRRVFAAIERLAPTDAAVLLWGETGSGKERVAKALHDLSPRAAEPFVVFDCGAASSELVDSELFGHVQGAFTGAQADRVGVAERAGRGTLLLDGVHDLPREVQPKLLRLLDKRQLQRVGEGKTRSAPARILASTSKDLEAEVRAGRFRSDLYFRLAVTVVHVPPLRERLEDIPLLAQQLATEIKAVDVRLLPSTVAALQCDLWPGNVRELRNVIERVLALGEQPLKEPASPAPTSFWEARERVLERFERDFVAGLIERYDGNQSAAARGAGISRRQMTRLVKRHRL